MSSAGQIRRRSLKPICYIEMTAFLSIQLVLLFMFMMATASYPDLPRGPSADLPKVGHPVLMRAANREDAMVVALERTGEVWLGHDKISPARLADAIREGLGHGAERKVYVRADARAKYGRVHEVLDAVHSAGIERVGFLVEQPRASNSAP
jgi:biopolymer transport protein ExbD/biopolymer transport protein TolR